MNREILIPHQTLIDWYIIVSQAAAMLESINGLLEDDYNEQGISSIMSSRTEIMLIELLSSISEQAERRS